MDKMKKQFHNNIISGHRIIFCLILCLVVSGMLARPRKRVRPKIDERIYLVHADELKYDMFGPVPDAQIVKGKVHFRHAGAQLWCDSAYFFQQTNSVKAFGHVRFVQGDTLSLQCKYAAYDGQAEMMQARNNVVLKHRRQTLFTDSLNYDRLYDEAYFFEGGRLIDGRDHLIADWGRYNLGTRKASFYYNVKLYNGERLITTDTLYYDARTAMAHMVGPSKVRSKGTVVTTSDGYYNTHTDRASLYGRSTVVDKFKSITGDSLYFNNHTGMNRGFGHVVYIDKKNKNRLDCGKLIYNSKTGRGFATRRPLATDYSHKDTLWLHSDTMRIETFNMNTDSMYRKVHCYPHVKVYRTDVQAICDSMVASSRDSCLYMYKDPIAWYGTRQLLGEVIQIYMADSTVRQAEVHGQALSVEKIPQGEYYNQISSQDMYAYFLKGNIRRSDAVKNVLSVYYPVDDKDSTLIGLNYLETDTMRMFMSDQRKLQRIWTPRAEGTLYPMSQIPPSKKYLPTFAWFDNARPTSKDDVFVWRGKTAEQKLKPVERKKAPLQKI